MERRRWGSRHDGGRGRGNDEGDACLVLCLSLPVLWWNAESHERGPLSLYFTLRLVSCVCLKSTTVPLLTHYLSADFSSAPKTAANTYENTHNHMHGGMHTHTVYRCALQTQLMSFRFPSNRKSELRHKQTHKIPSS